MRQERERSGNEKMISTQVGERTRTRIAMDGKEHYRRREKRMRVLKERERAIIAIKRKKEKIIATMREKERDREHSGKHIPYFIKN